MPVFEEPPASTALTEAGGNGSDATDPQLRTPYLDALEEYSRNGTISFHVPGHKQGKGIHKRFRDIIGDDALRLEITQVLGLDDVHHPTNAVKDAQALAAAANGADHTFFLINGSSSGVQAMIMGTCGPDDPILVPRNAHKSVFGALIMTGARPVYVYPEYDYEFNIDHTPLPSSYEERLRANPDVRHVLLSSPTYFGVTADVKSIVERMHELDRVVLVDEAWGAHLRFHPDLPTCALDVGADMVVNSTHKLCGAMSQGSMLHIKGTRVDADRVQSVARLFLSTSPSCLILASLDAARMQLATEGKDLLERTIQLATYCRDEINKIPGLHCFGNEITQKKGAFGFDPTRIVIQVRGLGHTGYDVEAMLRARYNIQAEMSDLFNVVCLVTLGDRLQDIQALVDALRHLARDVREHDTAGHVFQRCFGEKFELPDWPAIRMSPREAFFAPSRRIPLAQAVGHISSEIITPYPPGIPVLVPGEEITRDIIESLDLELNAGLKVHGLIDEEERIIRVLS